MKHLFPILILLLILASCGGSPPPDTLPEVWKPLELDWADREKWPRDTSTVSLIGFVRLPLEMTTTEDRSALELWPRRNQMVGTDLHMSILVGDSNNQQMALPESYADEDLRIRGNAGEVISHQSRVKVMGRWQQGQREVLEVLSIAAAPDTASLLSSRYPQELQKKALKNGEAEDQLVFATGTLRQPSIVLPDRDIDLVLAAKGFNVTARILMGPGPSQMKPAGNLLGQGELQDCKGNVIKGRTVTVYGVFHDGKIYVEEMVEALPTKSGGNAR